MLPHMGARAAARRHSGVAIDRAPRRRATARHRRFCAIAARMSARAARRQRRRRAQLAAQLGRSRSVPGRLVAMRSPARSSAWALATTSPCSTGSVHRGGDGVGWRAAKSVGRRSARERQARRPMCASRPVARRCDDPLLRDRSCRGRAARRLGADHQPTSVAVWVVTQATERAVFTGLGELALAPLEPQDAHAEMSERRSFSLKPCGTCRGPRRPPRTRRAGSPAQRASRSSTG